MSSTRYALPYISDTEGTPAVPWQQAMDVLDGALSGLQCIALSNANVTLSDAQSRCRIVKFTGTLTANVAVLAPATSAGERAWVAWNATSGAYSVTLKTSAGGSTGVALPQGKAVLCLSDGTNVTAVTVLAGSGSGLDADTLDGLDSVAFALLASPLFSGTPAAPTAPADTNTTQLATTAFVAGQAGSAAPAMDAAAAAGTSLRYARQDHVHPSDTSRAPLASPALSGTPTAPTAAAGANSTQLATTAYVDTNPGAFCYNYLVNGGFDLAQRQTPATTTTIADQKYGPDRWKCERENADLQHQRNATASASIFSLYVSKFTKITNAGKILIYQPLTARNTYPLRGRTVTFQISLLAQPNATLRIGLLELGSGGADDVIPSPLQTAWGAGTVDPTWGANLSLLAGAPCAATATRATFSVTGTLGSATRNLVVAVWSDSQMAATDSAQLREAGLYVGSVVRTWAPRGFAEESAMAEYFYRKSYARDSGPGTSTQAGSLSLYSAQAIAGTTAGTLRLPVSLGGPLRSTPTVTLYGTTGTSGAVRNLTASTDRGGATAANVGDDGFGSIAIDNSSANAIAANDALAFHWTADAEL